MKRLLVIVAAMIVLVAIPNAASGITNGTPDSNNRYPFVGLLAFRDADGVYSHRCSGTLLSPTIVLTASHCTEGMASAHAYFSFEVPDDFRTAPSGVLGTPHTHPEFRANTLQNDVAVVVLSEPVALGAYPTLPPEGFLSDLKAAHEIQDDTFLAAGYGLLDGFPPPNLQNNEDRWFAVSPYGGLNRGNLHLQQNPNSTGLGGTCFGDS